MKCKILLIGVFLLTVFQLSAATAPRLKASGNKIVDPCGNEVMLKGIAMPDPAGLTYGFENNWGNPKPTDVVDKILRDLPNINVIRIQIEPINQTALGYQWCDISHDAYYNYLKTTVDYITNKGLYVIIDWHYITNTYGTTDGHDVDVYTKEFWNYMAPKFKDYTNVIYEVFNEPIDGGTTWASYKSRVNPWVTAIRTAAPSTPIMVGGPSWSQEIQGAATDPFSDNNIFYVTHIYTFHVFSDLSAKALQVKANRPVILGEWGWDSDPNGYDIAKNPSYPTQIKKFIDDNHISFINWWASAGDNFDLCFWKSDWNTLRTGAGFASNTCQSWITEYKDKFNASSTCGVGSVIKVYAAGTNHDEILVLKINGTEVKRWTVTGGNAFTPAYQELTYTHTSTVSASQVEVHFINDSSPRDLRVDRINISGSDYQSEQANSTGSWTGSTCGNASSEWLHCNGRFLYASADTPAKTYEAENGSLSGTFIGNSKPGSSGTGYVDGYDATNDKVTLTINVANAGQYPLTIRYATCNNQQNYIRVNGGSLVDLSFPGVNCNTWQDKNAGNISLNSGNNTLEIVKNWGYFQVDYVIVGNRIGARLAASENTTNLVEPSPSAYPIPSNGTFTLPGYVDSQSVNVVVTNQLGNQVKALKSIPGAELTVNLADQPAGIYLIQVNDGTKRATYKVIVAK